METKLDVAKSCLTRVSKREQLLIARLVDSSVYTLPLSASDWLLQVCARNDFQNREIAKRNLELRFDLILSSYA
jgi:hypothetical protein